MMFFKRLIKTVKLAEGFDPRPYRDPVKGVWTIGYGNTFTGTERVTESSPPVTERQASHELMSDLYSCCIAAEEIFSNFRALTSARQEAMVELAFILGKSGLANFKRMCHAIELRRWEEAADEFKDSLLWRENQIGNRKFRIESQIRKGIII